MYIFTDPSDPLRRYIDSYVNEHFQDDRINCTIKWTPQHPTAGIYAKRDIYLNDELFTGYAGTLAKGLAGAHFGEKDQMKLKNETVE
jgi:hypothetical protein